MYIKLSILSSDFVKKHIEIFSKMVYNINSIEERRQNVEPIFQAVFAHAEENIKLGKIRDSLLPKLMSGELDVSDLDI